MSAASTPAPSRAKGAPRHTLFFPMLILLFGVGALALYQVVAIEDKLDEVTKAVDQLDGKVKRTQHEKAKFYSLARDVVRLAPKDPNAQQVAVYFKLKELQAAEPALMSMTPTPDSPSAFTNVAPVQPASSTNAPPPFFPGPTK